MNLRTVTEDTALHNVYTEHFSIVVIEYHSEYYRVYFPKHESLYSLQAKTCSCFQSKE